MQCFQLNINHHFIFGYGKNCTYNIFSTCFRRKICSPYNHLFYLSKEMDNVLTGEVGTFDMYAKFTVTKYLFTQPTQMILQWYTNLFNFWKLMNDENSREWWNVLIFTRKHGQMCSIFLFDRFRQKWGYGIWNPIL